MGVVCSGRVAWMSFIMFLLHTLARVLQQQATEAASSESYPTQLSKLVFVARHIAGVHVETHFFYFDKDMESVSLPTDPVKLFRRLIGRNGTRSSSIFRSPLLCHFAKTIWLLQILVRLWKKLPG